MTKKPIDISTIRETKSGTETIAEACLDYLRIEQGESTDEDESYALKNCLQRIRSGKSIIVVVDDIELSDDESEYSINVHVNYSQLPLSDPSDVLSAFRKKATSGTTIGSFMTMIPVKEAGRTDIREDIDLQGLWSLRDCPTVTIEEIDMGAGGPNEAKLVLNSLNFASGGGSEFTYFNETIEATRGDEPHMVAPGDAFILDPTPDDPTGEKISYVLEKPDYSASCQLLDDLINGTATTNANRFDASVANGFADWMQRSETPPLPVNTEQRGFITDVDHEISVLQGPPGTGKTSGALAPALIARLLSHDEPGPCRELVSGASNKAIDEVMADVIELLDTVKDSPEYSGELDDVMLLRVSQPPAAPRSDVVYTAFYDDEHSEKHIGEVKRRLKKSSKAGDENKHIIAFATPGMTYRVADAVIEDTVFNTNVDKEAAETQTTLPGMDASPSMREYELFDVVAVDEGSMMPVSQFLLSASFYDRGGNILISGDHRQLPPVHQHEWHDELRPSITEFAPYLSVLNFCRVLMPDEEVNMFNDDMEEIIGLSDTACVDIPLHQLQKTYRCHMTVADFLEKWVYMKLDGIQYSSDEQETIAQPSAKTDGMAKALNPDEPLTVLSYNDTSSQQSNPIEARIAAEIVGSIDETNDIGIVSPHNAQRGLVESTIQDVTDEDPGEPGSRVDVDTVERFQGGERDVIIMTATVSDPDYIAAESDFLLDLNRLNVAMSRMKKKLIVLVSESIPEHIPLDIESYDQALLWKGLAEDSDLADDTVPPVWKDSVPAFTGLSETEFDHAGIDEIDIQLYHL